MHHHNRSSQQFPWMTFLSGIAVGVAISVLIPPKVKEDAQHTVEEKAAQLKKLLTDPEERARIKDIFGEVTADTRHKYADVKDSLVSSLASMKGGWDQIDKQKYLYLISDMMEELKSEKTLTLRQIAKLKNYLQDDYTKLNSSDSLDSMNEIEDEEVA